jgi:hypothetical protein
VDGKGEDGKEYCIIENRKIEKETKREQIEGKEKKIKKRRKLKKKRNGLDVVVIDSEVLVLH